MSKLAMELIMAILIYGPSAVVKIVRGLQTDNPTPEEIRSNFVKMPETYFEEGE
jgi:hypothetical protein